MAKRVEPFVVPYPPARPDDERRELHGEVVTAPFHWLEELGGEEAKAWLAAQERLADRFFATTRRDRFVPFLDRHWREAPKTLPLVQRDRVYFFAQRDDQEQPALFCRRGRGEPVVVVDPTRVHARALVDEELLSVSPSGRYVAYGLARSDREGSAIRVWDSEGRATVEEEIPPTAVPTVAWHPSEEGFFYNVTRSIIGVESEEQADGLYWHRLGTAIADDRCLVPYVDGEGHGIHPFVHERTLFAVRTNYVTSRRGVEYWPLPEDPGQGIGTGTVLFNDAEAPLSWLGACGSRHYFATLLDAPRGRVVAIDLADPARQRWREIVAEGEDSLPIDTYTVAARCAALVGERLLVVYLHHGHHVVRVFDLDGRAQGEVPLPSLATVYQIVPDAGGDTARLSVIFILEPHVVYRYRAATGELTAEERTPSPLDPQDYSVEQVFYPSYDGTRVPMTIVQPKGRQRDGAAPTFLYGYGGWGQSVTPKYYPEVALWLHLGGTYAYANLRGGGEYGADWRRAGSLERKQTTFDDFQAAAEYLCAEGYTRPARLGIKGLSAGGLLTAVCYNQRPELYGAVVAEIPLVDVLALGDSDKGRAVAAELGNPRTDRRHFEAIRGYSPLHNVGGNAAKPPLLVVVAECDESAYPGQGYRFVAACQAAATAGQLVLLRVVPGAGHVGWSRSVRIRIFAEEIAFLAAALMPEPREPARVGGESASGVETEDRDSI